MKYVILSQPWADKLQEQVNQYLANGYKLAGGVSVTKDGLWQAVYKD